MSAMAGSPLLVNHFDVFVRSPGGGNPCPVVPAAAGLSAAWMQAIAAHYGEEAGFVLRDEDGWVLRFFVPRHEMAMCVHATVAAVTALVSAGLIDGGDLLVRTASGPCRIDWDGGDPPQVTVEQQPPVLGEPLDLAGPLADALGLPSGAIDDRLPVRSVSVSRAKLIVPVRCAADVQRIEPDLAALWQLCGDCGTTGAYVFAPHPDGAAEHVVARQFPVDVGYPEDAATGVAAGALAAYLADQARPATETWLDVDIDQGDAMGRPSRLRGTALAGPDGARRSTVRGQARLRSTEQLDLATLPAPAPGLVPELR
jgi:phenazine biosynthesis protein PhzF family